MNRSPRLLNRLGIAIFAICVMGESHAGVPPFQRLVIPPTVGDSANTGESIAVGDTYMVAGSPLSDVKPAALTAPIKDAGEVYVFNVATGALVRRLTAPVPAAFGLFGEAVAVQGRVAYVGSSRDDSGGTDSGLVCAFDIPTGKLLWKTSGSAAHAIGFSLAVDGDILLAGGPYGELSGKPNESGVVARLNAITGFVEATYSLPAAAASGHFGWSVALAGKRGLGGAPDMSVNGNNSQGLVGVIDLRANTVTNTLTSSDGSLWDDFGTSVAISRDVIAVGAPGKSTPNFTNLGSVYLFSGQSLAQSGTFNPSYLQNGLQFGRQVALNGKLLAAASEDYESTNGHVWLKDLVTGELVQCAEHGPSDADHFGSSLAMTDEFMFIGDSGFQPPLSTRRGALWRVGPLRHTLESKTVIARSGDAAPGLAGPAVAGFGDACINSGADVMHTASLKGAGVGPANNAALLSTLSNFHELVLRKGDIVNTQAVTRLARAAFKSSQGGWLEAIQGTRQILLRDTGMNVSPVSITGVQEASYDIPKMASKIDYTPAAFRDIADAGGGVATLRTDAKTGVNGVTLLNDSRIGVLISDHHTYVTEGHPSVIAQRTVGQIAPRVASEGYWMAYTAAIQGGGTADNAGIFSLRRNANTSIASHTLVARKGEVAHGSVGGGKFSSFISEAITSDGRVCFKALLSGSGNGSTNGLWTNRDGLLKSVAYSGQSLPGVPAGVVIRSVLHHFIATSGDIVFSARLMGPGVNAGNDVAVWHSHMTQGYQLLLREGSHAPETFGARVGSIQHLEVNAAGEYGIVASLTGSSRRNLALFAGDVSAVSISARLPQTVLRKGLLVNRAGSGELRSFTLSKNNVNASGSGSRGGPRLTAAGQTVFTITYGDGQTELVRMRL